VWVVRRVLSKQAAVVARRGPSTLVAVAVAQRDPSTQVADSADSVHRIRQIYLIPALAAVVASH
jgi:hypothetical protein